MARTYEQVMRQIDTLKAEAERLRRKEADGVIERIRGAIEHYGLTAADLGLSGKPPAAARKPRRAKAAPKVKAPAKFQDETGRTWAGRGKRPQWLRDALAAGRQLDEFKVT
jgi:DNA-binding protein H-NS